MKMEYILADGLDRPNFDRSDRIAAFARAEAMAMHGHTLIWYAQDHAWLKSLPPARFAAEYDRWITTVAGRYRGQAVGWDVVNEPVAEDGSGLREHLWSRNLGQIEHMVAACKKAVARLAA